jgi:low affinity Fe/Cu permease
VARQPFQLHSAVAEKRMDRYFSKVASAVAHASGKPITFVVCCMVILVWAVTGPVFGFSDTWQLIINTGTTIDTILMVFLIQNTQNRDGAAIQAKLDELIRVTEAKNAFIGIEHLTEQEVEQYRLLCEKAAQAHDHAVREHVSKRAAKRERMKSGKAAA